MKSARLTGFRYFSIYIFKKHVNTYITIKGLVLVSVSLALSYNDFNHSLLLLAKWPPSGAFLSPFGGGRYKKPMPNPWQNLWQNPWQICRTDGHLSDGRTKSVGRTDKICRTDGHNLSDGQTHSNAPEKTHYIRKTFLFMLRSAPKLFYYHQLGERIPKMGLDLKSVHGKGSK